MNIIDKLQDLKYKLLLKIERKKECNTFSINSIIYYLTIFSIVIGYGFFFNSNALLNKNSDLQSTPLFEKQALNNTNTSIELRSRKYNPINNSVEFMFTVNNDLQTASYSNKLKLEFEVREKSNPIESIEVKSRQIDANNYVVLAKAPSKWSVLSVAIGDRVPGKENESIFNTRGIRFYTNYTDIKKDINLKEKNTNEYLADSASNEIEIVKIEIKNINKKIERLNNDIKANKETIDNIEEGMKYQIETEIEISNSEIESIKATIANYRDDIYKYNKEIKEKEVKIKKLESKRDDYLKKLN